MAVLFCVGEFIYVCLRREKLVKERKPGLWARCADTRARCGKPFDGNDRKNYCVSIAR